MRISNRTQIAGALTRPGGRSAGNWCRNGSGPCAWNWDISCTLTRSARPNLLLLSHLLHRTQRPPRAMLLLTWACPGRLAASRARTLLCSPMERCVARLPRSCSCMSNAEKPMEACASCMEPASAVVVPVCCASSASAMATPQQSRAREVASCIPSPSEVRLSSGMTGAGDSIGEPVGRGSRDQHIEVRQAQGPPSQSSPAPAILSRAQRARFRLSWAERLTRNASVPANGPVRIKLFGVPDQFADFLGLRVG
jgi:hypothetical protein